MNKFRDFELKVGQRVAVKATQEKVVVKSCAWIAREWAATLYGRNPVSVAIPINHRLAVDIAPMASVVMIETRDGRSFKHTEVEES
jgi:hypothetical protein